MKVQTETAKQLVRPPRQDRSQASFGRVLDAAVVLLEEKGYEGFTLLEVSAKARTSIGSIYCRVKSKDDLIRAVQLHVLARLEAEVSEFTDLAKWQGVALRRLVPHLIRELGEFLRRNAAILRALQSVGASDIVIVGKGEESYWRLAENYEAVLLQCGNEIKHPKPKHAVQVCFDVPYATLQKYLGIGIRPDVRIAEGSWQQLLDDLATLCTSFLEVASPLSAKPLSGPPKPAVKRAARRAGAVRKTSRPKTK